MEAPSMVQRSGDQLIIRSVVSGDQLYMGRSGDSEKYASDKISLYEHSLLSGDPNNDSIEEEIIDNNNITSASTKNNSSDDSNLPQCKIKRNYSCNSCSYFTQNPRHFLAHLRDIHGEKIIINECKHCLYASRHYQKLVRHMKMVHGSTDGLEEQAQSRKRASQLAREEKKRKLQLLTSVGGGNGANSVNSIGGNLSESVAASIQATPTNMLNKPSVSTPPTIAAAISPNIESPNQMNSEILNQKFLKCTICDYTTLYRTQMVEHEREEHHKTKFFRCQKCSYVTHIKARFSKHVKYHSMPMIKCVMCDFRTPYKWNLDRHMKNHGGAGPFKCSACNFTADIKQSLTVHEMNHHVPPVGHATGMNMTRRRNKVGGTDLTDADYSINICENSSGGDGADNNNSNDGFDSSSEKRAKYDSDMIEQEYQSLPADLSQKPSTPAPAMKKTARPLPNLIPIQPMAMIPADVMNLSVRNALLGESSLAKDTNDLRIKPQSVLKDLASLFVSEEVFDGASETSQLSPVSNASSAKRKNSNFFNELKEKFAAGNRDGNNLMCECGHSSKCLSEAIIHKKSCGKRADKHHSISPVNLTINNCGGSTRCQYCRHRCKTSTDLFIHLQSCEARNSAESDDSVSEIESSNGKLDVSGDLTDEGMIDLVNEPHPMENKVFVWNKLPQQPSPMNQMNNQCDNKSLNEMQREDNAGPISEDSENNDEEKADDSTYYGVETAPGYGEVTKKMGPGEDVMQSSLKKVFKCPHCSFWASTASRFHVHIVGHLNKKPFECSLCSYRSNWRWDITKHIRLKTIRDVSHKNAKVLMNDETGRRNYTKYNKYITLMKVTDEDGDPKLMKSGEMTPSQEASVAYCKKRDDSSEQMDEDRSTSLTQNALLFNISNANKSMQFNSFADNGNEQEKPSEGDASTKKVSFKCKKCNFRHTNRDVVLQHVKGHYKEANNSLDEQTVAGLNIANANEFNNNYVNGIVNAAKLLIQQHPQLSQQTDQTIPQIRIQALNQLSGNSSHIFLADAKQQPLSIPSITPNTTSSSSTLPSTINQTTATNENGEMEEASSGLSTVNSGSGSAWRGSAPYRCGICFQTSNWKHVIQRHCRLKHDGDIQIEIKLKGSNDVYQPLALHNSGVGAATVQQNASTSSNLQESAPSTSSAVSATPEKEGQQSLSFLTKQYPIKLPLLSEVNKKSNAVDAPNTDATASTLPIDANQTMDSDQRNMIINFLAKSNILYNGNVLALIKPSEFRCQLCNFEAVNEAMLNQHIQTHLSSDSTVVHLGSKAASNATDDTDRSSNDLQIDLDDAIITSKVPNKSFVGNKEIESDQSTNTKQMQRIQERRQILSNGRQNDKAGAGTTDGSSDSANREERCPHCPFSTNKNDVLKEHIMCHICVSGQINLVNCNFCDFSIADEALLSEHSRIHFGLIKSKQKPVAFYTSYDNLEITTIDQQNNNTTNNNNNNETSPCIKTLYPKINFDLQYSSDKENKVLVDVDTGHILK